MQDRGRLHDVQVGVVLACEGSRRGVLDRGARSDGVGRMLIQPTERLGDGDRYIVRNGDPFESPADLSADGANRVTVLWTQARQPIDPDLDGWRLRHDPPKHPRRHAEASRHVDALDSRELAQVRAFATNDPYLRPVDLLQIQHVRAHSSPIP